MQFQTIKTSVPRPVPTTLLRPPISHHGECWRCRKVTPMRLVPGVPGASQCGKCDTVSQPPSHSLR